MRLRNIAGSREVIADSDFTVKDPNEKKGLWKKEVFGNDNRIRIEIGKRHKTKPEEAAVTFDGTLSETMSIIDSVEITASGQVTRILKRPGSRSFGIFHPEAGTAP